MFVAHDLVLDVPTWAARARLSNLVCCGALAGSAAAAYEDGLDGQIRVGPFGDLPGASKLVRVQFLDPVRRDDTTTLGMRWEATGAAGGLFPVLDADISLTPAAGEKTRLALAGSYRPPFGRFGTGLDRAILSRVATATVRVLLRSLADALCDPAAAADGQVAPVVLPAAGCPSRA